MTTNVNVTEENVATLIPQVGLNGTATDKPGVDNKYIDELNKEIEKKDEADAAALDANNTVTTESVKDVILNFKTQSNVSRSIRTQICKIYQIEEKIALADVKNLDKKTVIDLKRQLVFEKKRLSTLKKGMNQDQLNDVKNIEEASFAELKKAKAEAKKRTEKDVKESVDETPSEGEVVTEQEIFHKKSIEEYEDGNLIVYTLKTELNDLHSKLLTAQANFKKTGNVKFEKMIKGLELQIAHKKKALMEAEKDFKKDIKARDDKRLHKMDHHGLELKKKINGAMNAVRSKVVTEAADMEDEIKPIVAKFNEKGYKVKYASPGHHQLRKKEDKEPDGVYKGKLYSDARVMFDKEYNMGEAPKCWKWRTVDGCSYLDVVERNYDSEKGTPDEEFSRWKKEYMDSLRKFADDLGKEESDKTENEEEVKESVYDEMKDIMEGFDDSFF